VVFLGGLVHVRDLSFGMVMAMVFFAETLVLKSVDVGVVYLLSRYELVEGVSGIRWSAK
jgi:hypothetical protein